MLWRVLGEYADWSRGGDVTAEVVEHPRHDHFELVRFGWHRRQYCHGSVLHADIVGDKIWIHWDGTDRPLAEELVAAGVPKGDIVLGYKSPALRAAGEYAVG